MAFPQHLLVIDLETRPDEAILPADRNPDTFPKPIQHEIVTLGFANWDPPVSPTGANGTS